MDGYKKLLEKLNHSNCLSREDMKLAKQCINEILKNKDVATDEKVKDNTIIDKFKDEYAFLSNFYPCKIKWPLNEQPQFTYQNSEALFQAMKTHNSHLQEQFTHLDGSKAKKLGRSSITGSQMRSDWDSIRKDIMYEIVKQKFIQNPDLKNKLLATGDAYLIEGNYWHDTYWGVNSKTGEGENHLGRILMKVREELKNDC